MPIITSGADAAGDYLFGEGGLFSNLGSFFGGGQSSSQSIPINNPFVGGTVGGGGTSGGSAGASQAGAYTGEFGVGGPGNLVVDAANYLPEDYNILDD